MPEIREDWDHLDYRNRHAAHLIPLQQSTISKGILSPDDNNDTYRVIIRPPGWDNKSKVSIGKIPSLTLAQETADTIFHFTGSEPVHNTIAYLQINPLPVNDDLRSFSQREDYLEYVTKIAQGGQENQAKREELREWLHKVVEKVRENHRDDSHDEEEGEAENNYKFILVDDALTGGLDMRRNEMDMFDPLEVDEEEDGECHGNQAKAGLQQDQHAQSARDTPPTGENSPCVLHSTGVRNVLLQEGIDTLPCKTSADHYLEFLDKEGPSLLDHTRNSRQMLYKNSNILLKMAQELKVLKPPNPSILGPDFDISRWGCEKYRILVQLRHEMRLVRSCRCSSEVSSSGVYVLSSTPYQLILELMAQDFRDKMREIPPSS